MKYTHYFFYVILLSMISCSDYFQKEVNADFPAAKSQLVTSAVFRTDTTLKRLYVSRTVPILEEVDYDDFEDFSEAEVSLFDGSNTLTFEYDKVIDTMRYGKDQEEFYLRTKSYNFSNAEYFPLVEGSEYTLTVRRDGYETAVATTRIEPAVPVEKFSIKQIGEEEYSTTYDLRMTLKELPEDKRYYKVKMIRDTGYYRYPYFYEGEYTVSYTSSLDYGAILINSDLIEEESKSINLTIRASRNYGIDNERKLKTRIYVAGISKERVDYEKKVKNLIEAEDNPFISPLIIPTNFTGGLGYFSIENGDVYWAVEE